jgi:hypothetical protein
MHITKEFSRGIQVLFGVAIVMALYGIILQVQGNYGLLVDKPNSILRHAANKLNDFVVIVAFWGVVWYITKDLRASLVAGVIHLFQLLTYPIAFGLHPSPEDAFQLITMLNHITQCCAFAVFGLLHFKQARGLWMGLVYVVMLGVSVGISGDTYFTMIESLFRIFQIRDPFTIEIERDNGGVVHINYLGMMLVKLLEVLQLCIFWFIYHLVRFPGHLHTRLRVTPIIQRISPLTYSIIYWTLRLTLFVSVLGFIEVLVRISKHGFGSPAWFLTLCFCIGIYVVASLYRNFLSAYLVTKGKYPSYTYWFLNIPVLHVIAWITTLFVKSKPPVRIPPVESLDEEPETAGEHEIVMLDVQADFLRSNKNETIKILVLVFTGLFLYKGQWLFGESYSQSIPTGSLWMIVIGLLVLVWYMIEKRLLFPLFVIQSLFILIMVMLIEPESYSNIVVFGLVNLVLYYSLFHFDDIQFVDLDEVQQERPAADRYGSIAEGELI